MFLGVCMWKMRRSYNCMGKAGCFLTGDKFCETCIVTVGATTVYLRFSKWVVIIQMLTDLKWSPLTMLGITRGMVLTSKWEMSSTNRRLEPYVTLYLESYLCVNFFFFSFIFPKHMEYCHSCFYCLRLMEDIATGEGFSDVTDVR